MTLAPLTTLSLISCGPACGEGTVEENGECVATESDVHGDGDADTDAHGDFDTDAVFVGVSFVHVSAGWFWMGQPESEVSDFLQHKVRVTHDYYVGETEVTQGQFEAAMGYNPAYFTDCDSVGPTDCPVEQVTWHESVAYANAASEAARLQQCYTCTGTGSAVECEVAMNPYECTGYRLLTEAEWEGAARCGIAFTYAGSNDSADVAWTSENSDSSTHTVAGLAANTCGLYDMSGNVWEWTQDWYSTSYDSALAVNPTGPASGSRRVCRGGGWDGWAGGSVVNGRYSGLPALVLASVGFRLGRSVP